MLKPVKTTQTQLTDAELIQRYKTTGEAPFVEELFIRYSEKITALCLRYLKDTTQSEDAAMEVFEKLMTDIKNHEINNFSSWVYSVTKNYCLRKIETEQSRQKREKIFQLSEEKNMDFFTETYLHNKEWMEERLNLLQKCIEQLAETQRKCVELFFLQEKRYVEVAATTGYDINKVKSYLQNGKRNLKMCMMNKNG